MRSPNLGASKPREVRSPLRLHLEAPKELESRHALRAQEVLRLHAQPHSSARGDLNALDVQRYPEGMERAKRSIVRMRSGTPGKRSRKRRRKRRRPRRPLNQSRDMRKGLRRWIQMSVRMWDPLAGGTGIVMRGPTTIIIKINVIKYYTAVQLKLVKRKVSMILQNLRVELARGTSKTPA